MDFLEGKIKRILDELKRELSLEDTLGNQVLFSRAGDELKDLVREVADELQEEWERGE